MNPPTTIMTGSEVIVEWDIDETDKNEVEQYVLEMKEEGEAIQEVYEGLARRVKISGLLPDWTYHFQIRATNYLGAGPVSNFDSIVTPSQSTQPMGSITDEISNTTDERCIVVKPLDLVAEKSLIPTDDTSSVISANSSPLGGNSNVITRTQDFVKQLHLAISTRNLESLELLLQESAENPCLGHFSSLLSLAFETLHSSLCRTSHHHGPLERYHLLNPSPAPLLMNHDSYPAGRDLPPVFQPIIHHEYPTSHLHIPPHSPSQTPRLYQETTVNQPTKQPKSPLGSPNSPNKHQHTLPPHAPPLQKSLL